MQSDSAYEDQIREARARMREEGEQPLPQEARGPRNGGGNNGNNGQRRRKRGGRGNGGGNRPQYSSNARSSRQQQWDPRRSEPREPAYQQRKPDTQRPAPVVQVKQRRSLGSFVGALLGRNKPEEEKS